MVLMVCQYAMTTDHVPVWKVVNWGYVDLEVDGEQSRFGETGVKNKVRKVFADDL